MIWSNTGELSLKAMKEKKNTKKVRLIGSNRNEGWFKSFRQYCMFTAETKVK